MFKTTDGGQTWSELTGLRTHATGSQWQPGAGGLCLHTIIVDPTDANRIRIAISAAGVFGTDDGGVTWRPMNTGLSSGEIPDPDAYEGHCVHHLAINPSRPSTIFMQKHWDVMRSDDAGENWTEVSRRPAHRLRVRHRRARPRARDRVRRAHSLSDAEHFFPEGKARVFRSRTGGGEWEPLTKGLPQANAYHNVLRDAMAVDTLDECGVYFGTTGGQVYASADAGDSWGAIARDLPRVMSVEVQTLS